MNYNPILSIATATIEVGAAVWALRPGAEAHHLHSQRDPFLPGGVSDRRSLFLYLLPGHAGISAPVGIHGGGLATAHGTVAGRPSLSHQDSQSPLLCLCHVHILRGSRGKHCHR